MCESACEFHSSKKQYWADDLPSKETMKIPTMILHWRIDVITWWHITSAEINSSEDWLGMEDWSSQEINIVINVNCVMFDLNQWVPVWSALRIILLFDSANNSQYYCCIDWMDAKDPMRGCSNTNKNLKIELVVLNLKVGVRTAPHGIFFYWPSNMGSFHPTNRWKKSCKIGPWTAKDEKY